MGLPDDGFIKAMTSFDHDFGIDFEYLRGCPAKFLVEQIMALKERSEKDGRGIKKHRAMALEAEIGARSDCHTVPQCSEAMAWLREQIEREEY